MERIANDARETLAVTREYRTWRQAAETLDRLDGLDQWKDQDESDHYDWRLIRTRLHLIRQFRESGQILKLVFHLRQGLHWNLGNIAHEALYTHSRVGTKRLITDYIEEVCTALRELVTAQCPGFSGAEKREFFHEVSLSYGRSALMLSGGATLGLFHVGVVRALQQEGLLPSVLSGSSAGAVVAGVVGTHRESEYEGLLTAEGSYFQFWRLLPWKLIRRRRSLMDPRQLRTAIAHNVRDLTFEEAHRLTGKVLNITVSPAGTNQSPRLLNHVTTPHLYLREAIAASCSVPLLFPPVMLMTREETGERVPYMPTLRWNDGSLKSDLPSVRMRRLHNINHFIVSQTNPHVLPFLNHEAHAGPQRMVSAFRRYLYASLRTQASSLMHLARETTPAGIWREAMDIGASILDQDYRGHINIFPELNLSSYVELTANPSEQTVDRFIREGERAAWLRMDMIRVQTAISLTLEHCVTEVERLPLRRGQHAQKLSVVRRSHGPESTPE